MNALTDLTIAAARDGMRSGALGAVELAEASLAAAAASGALNAFSALTEDRARYQASLAAARLKAGDAPDLCGIPLGIKDLFCVEDAPAQAASRILEGFRPPYESTVTARLWESGAVCIGKLNMDEFAMGSSTETSVYGPAISPWRRVGDATPLTPGGSSGGSAAAVAADIVLGATGTDTGGSIRQPAAFTGIVGVKPTYGRCSRWGIVAFASSLDQAGPMAKTVRDAAILLEAMAGHDPKDSTSRPPAGAGFRGGARGRHAGKRIGIPNEYRVDGMPRRSRRCGSAASSGSRCRRRDRRHLAAAHEIRAADLLRDRARRGVVEPRALRRGPLRPAGEDGANDGHHHDVRADARPRASAPEVRRRIIVGTYVLSAGYYDAYYLRAQKVRTLIRRDFEQAFAGGVDAILTPATPSASFPIGAMADAIRWRCTSTTSSRSR